MSRFFFSPQVALTWLAGAAVVLGCWGATRSADAPHCASRVADEWADHAANADLVNDGSRGPSVLASLGARVTPPGDRCERSAPVNSSRTLNKLAVAPIPRQTPSPRRLPAWLPRGTAGRPAFATPSLQVLLCSWLA